MEAPLRAWVRAPYITIPDYDTYIPIVDLGGSLAVASRGLFATGVSTDLNGKQLAALLVL
jgi:hypothetical protein